MHPSRKMSKVILTIILTISLCFPRMSLSASTSDLHIYETGTRFALKAKWWGLSASGSMEILGNTKFRGKSVILLRSRVKELGGLMGFLVKFLRMYKKSNTFDSYIDPATSLTVRYEIYRMTEDGQKHSIEDIYFDRESNSIISLLNNKTIARNVAPDIQDTFSAFLNFLYKMNTETLFVGKMFGVNIYGYEETFKVEIEVTHQVIRDGKPVYTVEIKELPAVFKHPASISSEVMDVGDGFKSPVNGKCKIQIRVLPDITVKAELQKIRPGH